MRYACVELGVYMYEQMLQLYSDVRLQKQRGGLGFFPQIQKFDKKLLMPYYMKRSSVSFC